MKKLIALIAGAALIAIPAQANACIPNTITCLASICHAGGGTVTDYGSRKVGTRYIPWLTCA